MKTFIKMMKVVCAVGLFVAMIWAYLFPVKDGVMAARAIAEQHPDDIGAAMILLIVLIVVSMPILFVAGIVIALVRDHLES